MRLKAMDKKTVTQETVSGMSLLQVPGTEHESGNSRVPSATSSVKSGSIHFSTTVRMLAPVIWSRIQSRKKVGRDSHFKDCCCLTILLRSDVERPTLCRDNLLARPVLSLQIDWVNASLCEGFPGAKQQKTSISVK